MPPPRQVFIAVVGVGGVGKCFLNQLPAIASRFSQSSTAPIYLSVILLSSSSRVLHSPGYHSLNLSTWENDLAASKTAAPAPAKLADYLSAAPSTVVLIDNTSNQDIADAYPLFLKKGISIVTPNKKAFSSSYALWQAIYGAARNGTGSGGYVFHESSVGAGLPVLSTLRELVDTGDEVTRIEGVFSGTLSFLFNRFMPANGGGGGGGTFAAEVRNAKHLGYTEPDPRDDLNGLDVARKLTILARIVGLPIDGPASFPVHSLVPKQLESCATADDFLAGLPAFDADMDKIRREAAGEGKVVRFVGSIDVVSKSVKVGLESFDLSHPIAALKGSDNVISFYTKRYGKNPLIIQGAGAGGEVTAMGVSGDLIKVLRLLH